MIYCSFCSSYVVCLVVGTEICVFVTVSFKEIRDVSPYFDVIKYFHPKSKHSMYETGYWNLCICLSLRLPMT